MVKQTIQIHCRIKPTKQTVGLYEVGTEDQERDVISFFVPKDIAAGLINNKKEIYKFGFGKIFEQKTSQDEIFEHVAKPVIDSVLCGFNGTIFAYGQTGSGKTFTITGGAERYVDRGIIPRSLSYVFNYFVKNPGFIYTVHISYLEIYNDSGYDLLHPNHEAASKLEDLPKISMLEDYDGNIHLKNLSLNQATNEEEALNLLFLGDTNRMIAETPMNQASTRSHCIFTIHISMREVESATIRRSKLHLVDLAGSERVGKTGVGGTLLKEAKYINLSLHMLEQVIIALSEKSRSHIPYRNSMMTSVLRDSLGGNCMTTMIATCSIEKKNIDESISTCRFAQRVALVKNDALLNEELDPKLVIERLKREIQQLKDELSLVKGVEYSSELTSEEKKRLEEQVDNYLKEMNEEGMLSVGADMRKIKYCFSLFKHQHSSRLHLPPNQSVMSTDEVVPHKKENIDEEGNHDISYLDNQSELKKLKELVVQRDNEINILVKMLKKEKEKNSNNKNGRIYRSSAESTRSLTASVDKSSSTITSPNEEILARNQSNKAPPNKQLFKNQLSIGRQEAFEIFKRDYPNNKGIEDNKKGLKRRYGDAKKLGEQVNNSRQAINLIKGELEKLKSVRTKENAFIEEEKQLREELDGEKQKYKQCFNQLKLLKTEIEHMQHLLEKTKMKVQKDFEVWWCEQSAILSNEQEIKEAWKTPPITPMNNNIARPNYEVSQEKIENTIEKSDNRMAATFNRFSTSTPDEQHTHSRRRHSSHKTNSSRSSRSLQSTERSANQLDEGEMKSSDKLKQSLTKLRDIRLDQIRTETSKEQVGNQSTGIQLTGDKKTDDDILAFMKAREQLMRKSRLNFP